MSAGPAPEVAQAPATSKAQFARDVHHYLCQQPRQLPSRYLYDPLGSALFEAICRLPWYPLARAEARLIEAYAREIAAAVGRVSTIVELGSGSGEKMAALIDATGWNGRRLVVHLVDVSATALAAATGTLDRFANVDVVAHETTYERGLEAFALDAPAEGRRLALFLGSNIGNFDPPGRDALLRAMRAVLGQGDALLLGVDLVKPEPQLLLAYDDPLGVTAAFNRNLLVRLNGELGANFDLERFGHRALWNRAQSRVEMHLVCRRSQEIDIPTAHITLRMSEGDFIWTESSYKYRQDDMDRTLQPCGFRVVAAFVDEESQFALLLAEAA